MRISGQNDIEFVIPPKGAPFQGGLATLISFAFLSISYVPAFRIIIPFTTRKVHINKEVSL
jgi:hypothetical protein